MPKRKNNIYFANCTYERLYQAYLVCKRGKNNRLDVIEFSLDLEKNLEEILSSLLDCSYTFSVYKEFYVYEPKKRRILATSFKDRIVHTWYVNNYIIPYFVPSFISTSYACIKGKGMHKAAKEVQRGLRCCSNKYINPYIIKMDVTKFFENIHKDKVYELICRKVKDVNVLKLTRDILNSSNEYDMVCGIGIPIGNYTSQMFANIYLNELDRYVKHPLRCKWYYRYMDDVVIIVENKEKAKEVLNRITKYLSEYLYLSLNSKTQIFKLKQGVNFCGYKISVSQMRIRNKGKKRFVNKLKEVNYKVQKGSMSISEAKRSLSGHLGYMCHADTKGLFNKYLYNE